MAAYQSLTNSLYAGASTASTSGTILSLTDTTASTSTDSGALIVTGGVGVGGDTYIGGTLNVTGAITGDVTGTSDDTNALNSATTVVNTSSATAPTSGQVLTATSSTAATWQTPSSGGGGFYQIVTGSSGTAFNNTFFTRTYKRIEVQFNGVSGTDTSVIRIRMSGDNGSTLSSYFTVRSSQVASTNTRGRFTVDNCDAASGNRFIMSDMDETGNIISGTLNVTSGIINYIDFGLTAGTWDATSIYIVGWT